MRKISDEDPGRLTILGSRISPSLAASLVLRHVSVEVTSFVNDLEHEILFSNSSNALKESVFNFGLEFLDEDVLTSLQ